MRIHAIEIERKTPGNQCGTLRYSADEQAGCLLWIAQWRRAQKVIVEFVPAEGANPALVRAHHERLVDAVIQAVFERVSRKALFS